MSSKMIGHVWFTGRQTIGIVLAKDPVTQVCKAWIGTGHGETSKEDLKQIQEWGTKFDVDTALVLIRRHGVIDVSKEEFDQATAEISLETFETLIKDEVDKRTPKDNGG